MALDLLWHTLVNWMSRSRYFYPLMRFVLAASIALVLQHFSLQSLEASLYDGRMRWSPKPRPSGSVVTVTIDSKTIETLQGEPDVNDHTKLIAQIAAEHPEGILMMEDPTQWVGPAPERIAFAQTAAPVTNFFFTTDQIAPLTENAHLRLPSPFDALSLASAPVTRDNVTFAGDKVTRRILISYENQLMLQPILANIHNHLLNPLDYRGAFQTDNSVFNYLWMHPTGTYKPLSFVDVRDGRFPKNYFNDKIVVIGRDTQMDTDDYVLTSYSQSPLAMSRVEAQANIIDNLILNDGILREPQWVSLLLTVAVAYLTVILMWSVPPVMGIILILAQALVFFVMAYLAFALFGTWINMSHPLLAIFISYYFFIPYRLIVENKKSWEYAQKNRLLTEVEELKTNFLSMMSHDLKTPIARIQGMAETALNESHGNLSPSQRSALRNIMNSSDDLGKFIGSILDLTRIESKEVKLQKTSRDVNSVLKEVIKKYDFYARTKKIQFLTELDPLFSLKLDVDLIRQVFSNLVENAIKYSPENSKVIISSKEEDGCVSVRVKDNGPGIQSDEIENIFLKFYRGKDAAASPAKGSGLGLYLAKYFVDLHGGKISVESLPQQGSTFTVQLPVE